MKYFIDQFYGTVIPFETTDRKIQPFDDGGIYHGKLSEKLTGMRVSEAESYLKDKLPHLHIRSEDVGKLNRQIEGCKSKIRAGWDMLSDIFKNPLTEAQSNLIKMNIDKTEREMYILEARLQITKEELDKDK